MIQQKIDIEYVINSLLELEKMKTLLFDADQYSLFEHIPKPLLFEKKMIDSEEGKSGDKERFLMSHNSSFWNKKNKVLKEKDFIKALERIKAKENPDVIDERLIKLIDDFSS